VTATLLAQTAYAATAPVRTPRAMEYAAFQKVTSRMIEAEGAPSAMKLRAAAIRDNRRLWTILAVDLADKANGLPPPLRARLIYLAEFSLLNSGRALRDPAALRPLIEVNSTVMRGLSGEGSLG
jgi:flagellar protein FlaF